MPALSHEERLLNRNYDHAIEAYQNIMDKVSQQNWWVRAETRIRVLQYTQSSGLFVSPVQQRCLDDQSRPTALSLA